MLIRRRGRSGRHFGRGSGRAHLGRWLVVKGREERFLVGIVVLDDADGGHGLGVGRRRWGKARLRRITGRLGRRALDLGEGVVRRFEKDRDVIEVAGRSHHGQDEVILGSQSVYYQSINLVLKSSRPYGLGLPIVLVAKDAF